MELPMFIMVGALLVLSCSSAANAQTARSLLRGRPLAPAPAPTPYDVNLTDLLTVAGPYHTFLNYLQTTSVIDTFQNQANNSDPGITIFVPKDSAFSSLKKPSLSKLSQDKLRSLLLFHALPRFYELAEFRNLSTAGRVYTLAGGDYTLNVTDLSGAIRLDSGWSSTRISSSVYTTFPVAVYQVDKVLLPIALFGPPPPPAPTPPPVSAPETTPAADSPESTASGPTVDESSTGPSSDSDASSSYKIGLGGLQYLILAASGCAMFFF